MLTIKELPSDARLKEDGFNDDEIADIGRMRSTYFGLSLSMEAAEAEKRYDEVVELEDRVKVLEATLLHVGKHPRDVPLVDLKRLVVASDVLDPLQQKYRERVRNPATAIRAKCIECEDGQAGVKACVSSTCPLWVFRLGENPLFGKELPNTPDPYVFGDTTSYDEDDDVLVEEEDTDEEAVDAD